MAIYTTNQALIAKCKCGAIQHAVSIIGNLPIDATSTQQLAKIHHAGGKLEVVNTEKVFLQLQPCKCAKNKENTNQLDLLHEIEKHNHFIKSKR